MEIFYRGKFSPTRPPPLRKKSLAPLVRGKKGWRSYNRELANYEHTRKHKPKREPPQKKTFKFSCSMTNVQN